MMQRLVKLIPNPNRKPGKKPIQPAWRMAWVLAILAVAILIRVAILLSDVTLSGDAAMRYYPLAHNLLQGHGFSAHLEPPYHPNAFDQPGYPAFVALILWYTAGSLRAVMLVQVMLELGVVLLIERIARALGLTRKVQLVAVVIGLSCPFLAIWSVRIMTEVLAAFTITLACYTLVRAVHEHEHRPALWWLGAGLACGSCLLIRPDLVIAVTFMIVTSVGVAVWNGWRSSAHLCYRVPLFAVTLTLVLAPWTLRNYELFWVFRPLGMAGDQRLNGYVLWLGTWVDDTNFQKPYWWDVLKPSGPSHFPEWRLPDVEERRHAMRALELARRQKAFTGEAEEEFRRLAVEAHHQRFWMSHLWTPLHRVRQTWVRLPEYLPLRALSVFSLSPLSAVDLEKPDSPPEQARQVLQRWWATLLCCAVLGVPGAVLLRRKAILIPLALIVGRSSLPFISGIATEPRYLLEALPVCFIFMALGVVLVETSVVYLYASLLKIGTQMRDRSKTHTGSDGESVENPDRAIPELEDASLPENNSETNNERTTTTAPVLTVASSNGLINNSPLSGMKSNMKSNERSHV